MVKNGKTLHYASFLLIICSAQIILSAEVNPRLLALNNLLMRENPDLTAKKSWLSWAYDTVFGSSQWRNEHFIIKIQERISEVTANQNPNELKDSPDLKAMVDSVHGRGRDCPSRYNP